MEKTIRDYQIVEELNRGVFADLYLADKNDRKYVLKRYKDPTELSPDFNAFIENQETIWPLLQSLGDMVENIVEKMCLKGEDISDSISPEKQNKCSI